MDKMSSSGATTPDTSFTGVSSSTQVIPTAATEQQSFVPGLPFQMSAGMAPFFANPFISPFMPQQGVTDNNTTPVGGFFLSPTQYQEMMQQYFTQMMSANQYGMNISFPMPFSSTLVRPNSQVNLFDYIIVYIIFQYDEKICYLILIVWKIFRGRINPFLNFKEFVNTNFILVMIVLIFAQANGIESESIVDGVVDSHDKECVGKPISVEDERTTSLIKNK
uniref:Uncharacterized protein n=1 Tax=Heterorhabditis bacteriophora TaxID=37862 RepID=A0A1I7WZN5_HETBA